MVRVVTIAMLSLLTLGNAQEDRIAVKNEIIKSVEEVDKAREEMIRELAQTISTIERERAVRGGESNTVPSGETKVMEAKAIGEIAESTAKVEIAKIQATTDIVKAIDCVAQIGSIDEAEASAVQSISAAVSSVEVAKADAFKTMIVSTGEVERSKNREGKQFIDDASALTVAKNVSAVKIAKAVSAVEIAKAVSAAELSRLLPHETLVKLLGVDYNTLSIKELEIKAAAAISTAVSKVEVAKANALIDIARVVAYIEMVKELDDEITLPKSSYPTKFLKYKGE